MTDENLPATPPTKEDLILVAQLLYKKKESSILNGSSLYIPGSSQATEKERQIVALKKWYRETREKIEVMFKEGSQQAEPLAPNSSEDKNVSGT